MAADIQNGPERSHWSHGGAGFHALCPLPGGKISVSPWFPWITVPENGAKLRESVLTMAEEWKKAGYVDEGFVFLCQ